MSRRRHLDEISGIFAARNMTEEKFQENPLIERPNLEPMYNFAKAKHDATGAVRKHSGDPYWVHPSGVADLAVAYGGDDVEVQVAMAHDTLEDCDVTFEEIADQFGDDVAGYVQEITNDRDAIDKVGKEKYISQELCNLSHPALFVKLCDIAYNMLDYPKKSQAIRMMNNIDYMLDYRKDLTDRELELVDAICSAADHLA